MKNLYGAIGILIVLLTITILACQNFDKIIG